MSSKDRITFKNDVYYFKKSWKQKIGSITKIYAKGSDYERGYQFGKLLSTEIKMSFQNFVSYILRTSQGIPNYIKFIHRYFPFLLKPLLFILYRKSVEKNAKKFPKWMISQLEGMARGANIHPVYIKLMNVGISDGTNLGEEDLNMGAIKSCCSFAFVGKDGHLYHGKNLDWVQVEANIDLICFQQFEDEKGDWFAVIGPPGFLNSFEYSLNSHGISIGLTGRFYRGKRAKKQAITDVVELNIIRYAKNMADVKRFYNTKTGFDRTDGLLISSFQDKEYKVFEVTPMGAAMTSPQDDILFTTNTYLHQAFQKSNKQWGTIYNNEFCDPRHRRIREFLLKKPAASEEAFRILCDTTQPGFEERSFLGQATINRFITHVSALMVRGENPGIWIARSHTYAASNEYVWFDFSNQPQQTKKIRPANALIESQKYKNFIEFMKLRESRYSATMENQLEKGRKLLQKEPENPIFILFLAQLYYKAGKYTSAVQLLESHTLEWAADYWYCLGKCMMELQEYDKSQEYFKKALDLPSIDGFDQMCWTVCMVQLVKVNEKKGDIEATQYWKKALEDNKAKFSTPNIGMPDYPFINNINEQLEQIML